MARHHCMELRGAENSTLASVYSILVHISMRETTMVGLHCSMQYSMDMQSLLECCLNAGQRSKHGVFSAPLHCTRRYEGGKSKPCDYYWRMAQTSICATIRVGPVPGGSQRKRLENF